MPCFQERAEPIFSLPRHTQACKNMDFSLLLVVAKQGGKVKDSTHEQNTIGRRFARLPQCLLRRRKNSTFNDNLVGAVMPRA